MGKFVDSDVGQSFMSGNWGWYALILVLFVFNTVLGEELLFRGLLLPRMNRVFGRGDWAANGVLFAAYHLHVPWMIPATLLFDTFAIAYPAKRYQSAWIGIAVHSAQSVVLAAIVFDARRLRRQKTALFKKALTGQARRTPTGRTRNRVP